MDLTEGGIRVPCVARWPRVIPAGGVTEQLAITMDWTATFLEAAGVAEHPDYPLDLLPGVENADEGSVAEGEELELRGVSPLLCITTKRATLRIEMRVG